MPLIKCRDGVHRSPLAALDYLDPVFVPYGNAAETPPPTSAKNRRRPLETTMSAGRHPALDPMMESVGPSRILWSCDNPPDCLITTRSKDGRHAGFEVFVPVTHYNDLEITRNALVSYVNGDRERRVVHMASALDALDALQDARKDLDHLLEVIDQEASGELDDRPGDYMAPADLARGRAGLARVDKAVGYLKATMGIDR